MYTYTGLVQDPGHSTSVVVVMKMGNIAPRARIESTSLAFWVSVLTITSRLPDVSILPMPT